MARARSGSEWKSVAVQLQTGRRQELRRWLTSRRKRSERELKELEDLGLRRDAWRSLLLEPSWRRNARGGAEWRLEDPHERLVIIMPPFERLMDQYLSDDREKQKQAVKAFATAGIALVCDKLSRASDPAEVLTLGRLLERFEGDLRNPEDALRIGWRSFGGLETVRKRREERDVHQDRARARWRTNPRAFTTHVARLVRRDCLARGKECVQKTIETHIRGLAPRKNAR